MELHHRIVLAFAVGAAVLPVLGLRMHARKNLCHAGSLGCCGLAPVMTVNDHVYGKITVKDLPGILEQYK